MSTSPFRRTQIIEILKKHGIEWATQVTGSGSPPADLAPETNRSLTMQPKQFTRLLEELGPTFIKLGQLLATRDDWLPERYVSELVKLQENCEPLSDSEITEIISREFKTLAFTSGERDGTVIIPEIVKPLKAGSIGQAVEVKLPTAETGELQRCVIKLQRPEAEGMITCDIEILRQWVWLAQLIPISGRVSINELLGEFEHTIRNELDYLQEADNTEQIGSSLKQKFTLPVRVPHVYRDYASRKVLTISYVEGVSVEDFANSEPDPTRRRQVATTIAEAFLHQVFGEGFFHADPQPGNIRVHINPDTNSPEVGIIDFGMVGRLDQRSRVQLAGLILALVQGNARRAAERILEYGQTSRHIDQRSLEGDLAHMLKPLLAKSARDVVLEELRIKFEAVLARHEITLPADFVKVMRVLILVDGIGRRLETDFSFGDVAKAYLGRRSLTSLNREELALRLLEVLGDLGNAPLDLAGTLSQLNRGQLSVGLYLRGGGALLGLVGRVVGLSVFTSATLISAALVLNIPTEHRLWGYPILGLLLLWLSLILAFGLFRTLTQLGNHAK